MKAVILLLTVGIILSVTSCSKDTSTSGNANLNTYTYNVNPNGWSVEAGVQNSFYTTINGTATNTNDVVIVYIKLPQDPSGSWRALPTSNVIKIGDMMSYVFDYGGVLINYYDSTAITQSVVFEVAVISPAIIRQNPNTNWNDYSKVKAIISNQNINKN
jgi:hypothetical protein